MVDLSEEVKLTPEVIETLEEFDNFAHLRNITRHIAEKRGDWAGIPMPMDGHKLVIEPHYPNAEALMAIGKPATKEEDDGRTKVRNIFWSTRYRADVVVLERDGRVFKAPYLRPSQLDRLLATIDVSNAWGLEQEGKALHRLGGLIKHHQMKAYVLTGTFLEASLRSDLIYVFRRLRPTIAIRRDFKKDTCYILACLCMHPIAYYQDTWGGSMCPTDDLIAHLVMMRGDEKMFWRRCSQHQPTKPEAGLEGNR